MTDNCDFDTTEIDIDELVPQLKLNIKEDMKNFDDLLNLDEALSRMIFISDIYDGCGSTVNAQIRFWNRYDDKHNIPIEERLPIKVYIDSAGGSLTDSLTIIDSIKMSKTPIWTINEGCAYSGGFFIFIAGHKKFAYPHSTFLFHEGSTGNIGDASKFRNFADFYEKQLEMIKNVTIDNTNITEEQYKEHKKDDWWFTAKEAKEYGICDTISEEFV